jgi:putative peptidoglycan lipid II flippase
MLADGEKERANRLAGAVFSLLVMATSVIVLLGVLLAPYIVWLFAREWTPDAAELATLLVRIMFPGTGLLVVSAWCLAVLNSHRRFLLSYAAPVIWNVCIIAFLIYGASRGEDRAGIAVLAAIGAVVGSLLQVLVQLPAVSRLIRGVSFRPSQAATDVRDVARRFGPAVTARGSVQFSAYIDTWMIGLIPTQGLLAVLSVAQTLYQLPISLFGMSVAAAELPEISRRTDADTSADVTSAGAAALRLGLGNALRRALYFAVPSAVALALVGDHIVALLFERGEFGRGEVVATWVVLIGFAVGVIPATTGRIVAASFFAMRDTRTPVSFALTRIGIGAFLSATFLFVLPRMLNPDFLAARPLWQVAGLSLGGSLSYWVEFGLLYSAFESRIGAPVKRAGYMLRIGVAAVASAAVGLVLRTTLPADGGWAADLALILGFGVTYLGLTALMGVSELAAFARVFRRR